MEQIREVNERLARESVVCPSAVVLGMAGLAPKLLPGHDPDLRPAPGLPDGAVLIKLVGEGAPSFPYIWGHFADDHPDVNGGLDQLVLVVQLHTSALTRLSGTLGLHEHRWGLDAAVAPRS